MINNPFRRVELFATMGGGTTFGQWGPSVNISAAISNSRGAPLDWWARGSTPGAISNGIRKANSPNLFSVSVFGQSDGDPGRAFSWGDGTITYTDGPGGAGSSGNAHILDGPDGPGAGGGFRISIPSASQWPDWWLLKVWSFDYPQRRMQYKASLDNPTADTDEVWIDYYSPGPSASAFAEEYLAWSQTRLITTEVRFAADGQGQTLTYDMKRTYQYFPSIYAVALYKAAIVPGPARGAMRALIAQGYASPAGV